MRSRFWEPLCKKIVYKKEMLIFYKKIVYKKKVFFLHKSKIFF